MNRLNMLVLFIFDKVIKGMWFTIELKEYLQNFKESFCSPWSWHLISPYSLLKNLSFAAHQNKTINLS